MARDDPQTRLRFPPALKKRLEEEAKLANRSFNAEVIARLESSLTVQEMRELATREDVNSVIMELASGLKSAIRDGAETVTVTVNLHSNKS